MEIKQSIGDGSSFRYRPHFPGRAFLAIAMIAMLALAALLAAAPAQAQDQSAEPLWSADMLVAEITSVAIGAGRRRPLLQHRRHRKSSDKVALVLHAGP